MYKHTRFVLAGLAAALALASHSGTASAASCVPGSGPPPSAVTEPATPGAQGATLRGLVNPRGCPTTYRFDYGPTTQYGRVSATRSAGSSTSSVAAAAAVGGLAPDTVYHFRIVASSGAGTTVGGDLALRTATACVPRGGPPPAAVTEPATPGAQGATLRGLVNPRGCPTTYRFDYGPTTRYGRVSAARSAGSSTSSVAAAAAVGGLAQDTVYHFRIVASSGAGTTVGGDIAFRTKTACVRGRKPVVATRIPVDITAGGAALRGLVNPRGCPTNYRFQYGTTKPYRSSTAASSAGSGIINVAAMTSVAGLTPDTVYHFRILASSGEGTTVGKDVVFKTGTLAPSLVRIVGRRASVKRRFSVRIRLRCVEGGLPCAGRVKLFRKHRLIGRGQFVVAPNSTHVLRVRCNRRGRRLMRRHRRLRIEAVARSTNNRARSFITLVRRF